MINTFTGKASSWKYWNYWDFLARGNFGQKKDTRWNRCRRDISAVQRFNDEVNKNQKSTEERILVRSHCFRHNFQWSRIAGRIRSIPVGFDIIDIFDSTKIQCFKSTSPSWLDRGMKNSISESNRHWFTRHFAWNITCIRPRTPRRIEQLISYMKRKVFLFSSPEIEKLRKNYKRGKSSYSGCLSEKRLGPSSLDRHLDSSKRWIIDARSRVKSSEATIASTFCYAVFIQC
jgi:hypothetical protein